MKNLILPIALAAILLTACSKEESVEQFEEQNIDSVYVLNQFNETATWETTIIDNPQNGVKYEYDPYITYRNRADGLFMSPPQNGMTIQWTGSQTNQGSSGSAEFKQITPNFNLHFKMETECITVEGNEAVYGGLITEVTELLGDVPHIEVGWRFYFKVIDNESGGNISYDQIANTTIFASPMMPLLCNGYSPSSYIWASQGYTDVMEPGFVFVNVTN